MAKVCEMMVNGDYIREKQGGRSLRVVIRLGVESPPRHERTDADAAGPRASSIQHSAKHALYTLNIQSLGHIRTRIRTFV